MAVWYSSRRTKRQTNLRTIRKQKPGIKPGFLLQCIWRRLFRLVWSALSPDLGFDGIRSQQLLYRCDLVVSPVSKSVQVLQFCYRLHLNLLADDEVVVSHSPKRKVE